MKKRFLGTAWILLLAASICAGCCGGGGSKVQSQQNVKTTTLGQELTDLEKAYKAGAITEEQYKAAKEKLLKEYQ